MAFFHPLWCGNASAQFLFDRGIIKSSGFPLPVIGIGNLSTGGTGKTPHVEFLIRLLQKEYKVATLSRGYGRHTKGFMLLKAPANTWTYGDEPMQYFTKFPAIRVSVGEDRTEAIEELLRLTQRPDIILMDDAYQHRYVNPGHSILLIEYDTIFKTDFLYLQAIWGTFQWQKEGGYNYHY